MKQLKLILLASVTFSLCHAQDTTRLNRPLMAMLDTVLSDDQEYRNQYETAGNRYGWDSQQAIAIAIQMKAHDSVNTIKVTALLDQYGWLGQDVLGYDGNRTLFLVIQHSNLALMQKYLPMMQTAVADGKARASDLALMEDRTALYESRKQLYGSQLTHDSLTNTFYVLPLEDPEHVDERRAKMNLPPIAVYISSWNLTWDVEEYKRTLPALEASRIKRGGKPIQ